MEAINRVYLSVFVSVLCAYTTCGCSKISSVTSKVWMQENTPGHCLSVCKEYNHIGLEVGACHCISDNEFSQMSITSDACPYTNCHDGILCGNSTASWIYTVRRVDFGDSHPQSSPTKIQCIDASKHYSTTWEATNCDNSGISKPVLCLKNGTLLDIDALKSTQVSWIEAVNMCKHNAETIADLNRGNFRKIIFGEVPVPEFEKAWTSFILDSVIVKGDSGIYTTDPVTCASIQKTNGDVHLIFENCVTPMPAVCVNELPSTGTVTTTTFTTPVAATLTPPAPTKHDSTASAANAFNQLPRTSFTIVSNTANMQTETSTSHTVATGRRPTEASATSSMETLTTTASTTRKATSTSSKTESISSTITIPPSTSTITATTTYTTPKTTTRRTEASMTNGSTTPTTSIPNKTPKANTTKIFNTSNTQPTSTNLPGAKDSTLTETSATSSTRPITTTASITQGATNSSSTADFPMAGRIGLGILAILVVAGVVLAIKKMTAKKKRPPSIQTTADSSDHKTELSKGIPMLDVNDINDVNDVKHSNGRVGNSSLQTDKAYSTNCQYAKVVKVGKSSPKIIETTPEPDTNTYDTTYVHQEKIRDTGDDYQHIYDHTNSKNLE